MGGYVIYIYFQEKSKPLELFKLQGLEVKNPPPKKSTPNKGAGQAG